MKNFLFHPSETETLQTTTDKMEKSEDEISSFTDWNQYDSYQNMTPAEEDYEDDLKFQKKNSSVSPTLSLSSLNETRIDFKLDQVDTLKGKFLSMKKKTLTND